jgi:hypothetical protein
MQWDILWSTLILYLPHFFDFNPDESNVIEMKQDSWAPLDIYNGEYLHPTAKKE